MERDFFISMLEDEDDANASIALRELLNAPDLDSIIAEHQDSDNQMVRRRIHQLASMKNRRELMVEFPKKLNSGEYSNWEAMATVNVILDPRTSFQQLDDMLPELLDNDLTPICSTKEFCDTIRELDFAVDETSDNFIVKYLLGDTMTNFNGDPLLVAVVCQQLGLLCKWKTTLGRIDGMVCLLDRRDNICSLHPDDPNLRLNLLHFKPISVRELAIEVIGKIHSAACIDLVTSVFVDTRTLLEAILAISN